MNSFTGITIIPYTDDTALTVALAESLLGVGGMPRRLTVNVRRAPNSTCDE